jgi:hypothetical protein
MVDKKADKNGEGDRHSNITVKNITIDKTIGKWIY